MKILLASHPWDGHVNPMSSVAVHLQARGYDVRWYVGSTYANKLARLGVHHEPFVRAVEIHAGNVAEKLPRDVSSAVRTMFFAPIEPMYRDIADIHARFPFDAFICDAALYVSRIVAEKIQPRTYVLSPMPTPAPASPGVPPPFFGLWPARSVVGRVRDRLVHALLEHGSKSGRDVLDELRAREGLPRYRGRIFDLHTATARTYFQIGAPGLDFPSERPKNVRWVGAVLPHRGPTAARLPAHVEEKARAYRGSVAVSQGTTDNRDPEKLFVPTMAAFAGGDKLVVVCTGGLHTAALRERFPHDNILVEDWIDFHALLPRTELFVTNGGFGSVLLALAYDVPLLCAGKNEGKADVNARLAYNGVALDLRTERPTARQIARGAARVLGDPRYRARVRAARAELASYDSLAIIERTLIDDGVVPDAIAHVA